MKELIKLRLYFSKLYFYKLRNNKIQDNDIILIINVLFKLTNLIKLNFNISNFKEIIKYKIIVSFKFEMNYLS